MGIDEDLSHASSLLSKREFESAEERALEISPQSLDALHGLAELTMGSDPPRAEDCLRRILSLEPDDAMTRSKLARLLDRANRRDEADHEWDTLLHARKTSRYVLHLLVEVFRQKGDQERGAKAQKRWAHHIANTFDEFAGTFDETLGALGYRGPQLAQTLVEKVLTSDDVGLEVADIGCGTGLFSPLIASRKGRLVGVDLSSKMLERANERTNGALRRDRSL